MAKVLPFNGIRPSRESAATIAALPYDVYNRNEAEAVVAKNPDSFLAIDRAETNFDSSVGTYDEVVYQKAHDLLWQWVEEGRFIRDGRPCYYLYELTMNGRTQTGIVACASIDDYENGIIKKHENTRAEKEADRIHHVDSCNAQTGPIFLAYKARQEIDEIVDRIKTDSEAEYDFVSEDGIRHRVYVIDAEADVSALENIFTTMDSIYIADGHHRAASAVKVGQKRRLEHPGYTGDEEFNYFLSVLFPDNQLMIMDYNRVVRDLNGLSDSEFIEAISDKMDIIEIGCPNGKPIAPTRKGQVSMVINGTWYLLEFREADKSSDPVEGLDVSILQNVILNPILGITDPKTDDRIDFVGGIRGLEELERRCDTDCKVAFAMYPTSIGELFAVADAGRLMPPKSTWFEPKLRSGLFIHEI
ncbi:MAG: DUF1015 domain-containing protein [Lachnospiraceae bacterium]|nr:DUF1015 domain-containing protein [Lachnospiraceae bacterium]